jgi:hypothetical protein
MHAKAGADGACTSREIGQQAPMSVIVVPMKTHWRGSITSLRPPRRLATATGLPSRSGGATDPFRGQPAGTMERQSRAIWRRRLQRLGIDLMLHQQGLDTTTPAGKAMFQMMGVFAEFERAMIRERVKASLERARAQGKMLGRPTISTATDAAIRKALTKGDSGIRKIATTLGVGTGTVQRIKAEMSECRMEPAASGKSGKPGSASDPRGRISSGLCDLAARRAVRVDRILPADLPVELCASPSSTPACINARCGSVWPSSHQAWLIQTRDCLPLVLAGRVTHCRS